MQNINEKNFTPVLFFFYYIFAAFPPKNALLNISDSFFYCILLCVEILFFKKDYMLVARLRRARTESKKCNRMKESARIDWREKPLVDSMIPKTLDSTSWQNRANRWENARVIYIWWGTRRRRFTTSDFVCKLVSIIFSACAFFKYIMYMK